MNHSNCDFERIKRNTVTDTQWKEEARQKPFVPSAIIRKKKVSVSIGLASWAAFFLIAAVCTHCTSV